MSEEVDDFLAHFGIRGMKWGQRKSVERDDTERILKRGTELQTVTAGDAGKVNFDRRVFAAHTTKDKLVYQSTYAKVLKVITDEPDLYVNTLVPNKNLKVASEKAAYDAFKSLYEKDKPGMIRAIAESQEALTRKMLFLGDVKDQKTIDANFKKYSKKGESWLEKDGYDLFVTGAGASRTSTDIQNSYYTLLTKQGFDAIVDHTDKKAKMADDPIVILSPKSSTSLKSTVPLYKEQIDLATKAYREEKRRA